MVYVNDLEGKITKINLTNMADDNSGNAIKLYDSTTLFNAGSTKANGRYMYHAMDATIGDSTNEMWLFAGTGDYERIMSEKSSQDIGDATVKSRYTEVPSPNTAQADSDYGFSETFEFFEPSRNYDVTTGTDV